MGMASLAALMLISLSWLLALGWLWQAVTALRGMPTLPDLTSPNLTQIASASLLPLPPSEGPHLTVIVPACNEETAIQATLRSLLASTGLRLQIVAINDRSTDRTGELIDQVAVELAQSISPHSLVVIHSRELPAGWLGKPHALQLGAQRAAAPWLLFTDADVLFAPRALELALRQAIVAQADHLVLVPTLISESVGEAAIQAALQALAQWPVRLWKVAEPRASDSVGVGAFNMVRNAVFQSLGGMVPLRMEVIEDMSLGWMVKRAGYRSCVALGPGLVTIRWIRGAFGIVTNMEKNGFAAFRFNVPLAAFASLGLALQALLPVAAIPAVGWTRWALPAALLTYAAVALSFHANRRMNGISPAAALLFAPAVAIITFAFLRSIALTLIRNGIKWRGTSYPLSELRRSAVPWR